MSGASSRRMCDEEAAEAVLDEALRRAFWQSLHRGPLPPMLALQVAARAVGALYRQMADGHEGPSRCACGWEPEPDGDLIVLEANLAAALLQPLCSDLAQLKPLGRA